MPEKFLDEISHLDSIIEKLKDSLQKLDTSISKYEVDFKESMKYLWENKSGMDAMEVYSNEKSISQIVNSGEFTVKQKEIVEKLIDSPYFARIDFKFDGENEAEPFYIGRFSFADKDKKMHIYDWRAPVSGMYYDFELGHAFYKAPIGQIEGEITLKRQFKIKSSKLLYALESSISINDEVLQKELSATTDQKMKNIVATIQKEQNQIIRNESSEVLIIQGAAGSGKTSIALHRVAYFLYKYKERLSAQNIIIISPNKVFADYISNVLPELGEEPIMETGLEDIASELLDHSLEFDESGKQMEAILEEADEKLIERIKFKSSMDFLSSLDAYLEYAEETYFTPCNCTFHKNTISKDFIQMRYRTLKAKPVTQRLEEIADNIIDKLKSENCREGIVPSKNEVLKKLAAMFQFESALALYHGFYEYINRPDMFVFHGKLEAADVYPYIYTKIFFEGVKQDEEIQHIVIDEMQDYTPVQYAVIKKLYKGKKTILGDFGQSVNPYNLISRESLMELYEHAEFVELKKSYRSTYEIIQFARKIQQQNIEPIERHGDEPEILYCEDKKSEISLIEGMLNEFKQRGNSSLGIIGKSKQQVNELYKELSERQEINLLDISSTKFTGGITITTIHMAKGLEFDEVIIPFADADTYQSKFDRSLLYVACTRAMHKLTLTYHGKLSGILTGNTVISK